MSDELRQFEDQVERAAELLRSLPETEPVPAALMRVRFAVRSEAVRMRRVQLRRRWLRAVSGLAAAALVFGLVYGFGAGTQRPTELVAAEIDESAVLDWLAAGSQSGERWARLVAEFGEGASENGDTELREWLEILDAGLSAGV